MTYTERTLMCFQLRILAIIDPVNSRDYNLYREALESGFQIMYKGWFTNILPDTEEMTPDKSILVGNTLTMYGNLINSFNSLTNQEDLIIGSFRMPGFDGNNETEYMSYALFLIEREGKFGNLAGHYPADMNSHTPMVAEYEAMLREIETIDMARRNHMTIAELRRILAAR